MLVRRGDEIGIFTDRDVRERSLLMGLPETTPIGDLASYDLRTIDREDFLFNALVLMTERAIRHVVVTQGGGEIEGIFEQADLLGYLGKFVLRHRQQAWTGRAAAADLDAAAAAVPHLVRFAVRPRRQAAVHRPHRHRPQSQAVPPGVRAADASSAAR